jgi:hypothetical protein
MKRPGVATRARNRKAWLMTFALVVVPWGGVLVLLYGAAVLIAAAAGSLVARAG